MATNVGTLNINIQAGTAQFDQAMNKVQQGLKSAVVTGSALGSVIGNLFTKLTEQAGELAREMYEFARSIIDTDEQMGNLAQVTGTTSEKFSVLAYGAKLAGVSTEELSQSMSVLSRQIALAVSGNADAIALFKALGVSFKDASGHARDTGDVIVDLSKKFAQYRNDANKTDAAQQMLGRSGAKMIPYLNSVGVNIKQLTKNAQEYNLITGTDAAQQASKFNEQLADMQERLRGTARTILNPLLPSINAFIEGIGAAVTKVGKLIDKTDELSKKKLAIGTQQYEVVDVIRAADQIKKEQDEEQVNRLKELFSFITEKPGLNLGAWWTERLKGAIPEAMPQPDLKALQPYVEAAKRAREEAEKNKPKPSGSETTPSLKLPADTETAKINQQYDQRLKQIRDAITAQKLLNSVVGQGNAAQAVATGLNKAQADITQLNNARREKGIALLTKEQEANLKRQDVSEELNKLFTDYNTALDQQVQAAELALRQQENLTAATAQGADAVEQAHLANQILAADWGKEASVLDKLNGKVDKRNEALAKTAELAREAQNRELIRQIQDETRALDDQIDSIDRMTVALLEDDAAQQKVERDALKKRQEQELAIKEREGASQKALDELRLKQARDRDALAAQQRQQTLQQAKQDIGEDPEEAYQIRKKNLEDEAELLAETQGHALSYGQTLSYVAQQHEAVIAEQQKWVQLLLASHDAMDGVKAFFIDLQLNAKTAAQEVHDVLVAAFEGFSDYLAKTLTGAKASFSDFLRGLAEMILKAEITRLLTQLLTATQGKHGGFLGALSSVIGVFGGAKQSGGWISGSKTYLVGESGPEIISGATGYVHSTAQTRAMLGGSSNVINYAIDARGTDPVLTERRTRAAILAAHQSSVISSVQVSDEMLKRKPVRIGGK
jgi:hypothetical protein